MPGFTPAGKNLMLNHLGPLVDACSLHSGDPSTTGANELIGGTYTRLNPTIGTASNGEMFVTNEPTFDVPPSAAVRYVGFWVGATFIGSSLVTEEVYSENGGTYKVEPTTRLDLNG
jgi:hypothetical protein